MLGSLTDDLGGRGNKNSMVLFQFIYIIIFLTLGDLLD